MSNGGKVDCKVDVSLVVLHFTLDDVNVLDQGCDRDASSKVGVSLINSISEECVKLVGKGG